MLGGKSLSTIGVAALMLLLITLLLARSARRPKVTDSSCPRCCRRCRRAPPATAALPAGERRALPAGTRSRTTRRADAAEVDLLQAVENQPDDVAHLLRGWLAEHRDASR